MIFCSTWNRTDHSYPWRYKNDSVRDSEYDSKHDSFKDSKNDNKPGINNDKYRGSDMTESAGYNVHAGRSAANYK